MLEYASMPNPRVVNEQEKGGVAGDASIDYGNRATPHSLSSRLARIDG